VTTTVFKFPLRALVLLLLSVGGTFLVGAPPASAHSNRIIQGSDYADISGTHSSGYVCDNESDGNYTYVVLSRSGTSRREYDNGGADGVCDPFSVTAKFYTSWKMCEETAGADPCTKSEPL
jgi:hypothetical protein